MRGTGVVARLVGNGEAETLGVPVFFWWRLALKKPHLGHTYSTHYYTIKEAC
jgi:hypothetical protein